MFKHADRNDSVELTGHVAIILKQKLRRPRQVFLCGARVGDLKLFIRKRDASDVGSGDFREVQAEPTPTRADVEDAISSIDQKFGCEMTFFGELGVVERRIRRLKIGAAVLLVGIQKERIEPSVEIVVTSDIIFRAAARIELADMPDEISKPPLHLGPARQYL